MFFYICFAIALWLNPRRVTLILGPVLCVFCAFGAVVDLPVPLFYYARTNTLEFVYGMGIARLFTSGIRLPFPVSVLMLVCASGAAYAFAPYSDEWDILRGFGWGIPAAGIITTATCPNLFLAMVSHDALRRSGKHLTPSISPMSMHTTLYAHLFRPRLPKSPSRCGCLGLCWSAPSRSVSLPTSRWNDR